MDMIERVARAIEQSNMSEMWSRDSWQEYIPEAKAAIEAMREPTYSMVDKGIKDTEIPFMVMKLAYSDMIDAVTEGEGL